MDKSANAYKIFIPESFPDLVCPPQARTRDVMKEFSDVYEQQYAVALFNSVRFEIEGGGGTQSQLLHRKASA